MEVVFLAALNAEIGDPGFPFRRCWQALNDFMGENRRAAEVEALVHKVIVGNLAGNGSVLWIGVLLVEVAQLVLHQLAVQRSQSAHGEILTGQKRIICRHQAKGVELELFPEPLESIRIGKNHRFGKQRSHWIRKHSLPKQRQFHLLRYGFEGIDMRPFLVGFQVQHVAHLPKVVLGKQSGGTGLIEVNGGDFGGDDLAVVGHPVQVVENHALVVASLFPNGRTVEQRKLLSLPILIATVGIVKPLSSLIEKLRMILGFVAPIVDLNLFAKTGMLGQGVGLRGEGWHGRDVKAVEKVRREE